MSTPKSKNLLHKIKLSHLLVFLFLVLCVALLYFFVVKKDGSPSNAPNTQSGELTPATPEETAQAEDHKKELANEKTPTAPTEAQPATVTPFISYAGQTGDKVEVVALVPGLSQDGGTCTALFTQASRTVSKQVPANRNASTTDCQAFTVSKAEFPTSGDWSVAVSYESSTAKGTSEPYVLNIK